MAPSSKDYDYKTVGDGQPVGVTVYWEVGVNLGVQARPVALLFHGGAFIVGTRSMIPSHHIDDLLTAGFVVASADYSLLPQAPLYHGAQQDAKDAYRWCRDSLPGLLSTEGVSVDGNRIVVVGYSAGATLALVLGAQPEPPLAIVDFYGPKYFQDPFWSLPLTALSKIPDFDDAFLNKVFDEPLRTSTASSLERATAAARKGPPKPDLTVPRNAWLFSILKKGTYLRQMVPDGNLDRVDPIHDFSTKFPPTYFLHGTADEWVLPKFSKQAHQTLSELGVETNIALVPDLVHGFDAVLLPEDPRYLHIQEAFGFLKKHAEKGDKSKEAQTQVRDIV